MKQSLDGVVRFHVSSQNLQEPGKTEDRRKLAEGGMRYGTRVLLKTSRIYSFFSFRGIYAQAIGCQKFPDHFAS